MKCDRHVFAAGTGAMKKHRLRTALRGIAKKIDQCAVHRHHALHYTRLLSKEKLKRVPSIVTSVSTRKRSMTLSPVQAQADQHNGPADGFNPHPVFAYRSYVVTAREMTKNERRAFRRK